MFPRYSYSACVCGNRVIYIWQSNPRCIPLYVRGIPAGLFRVSISIYILPNIAFILTQMQGQTMRLFALVHTAQSAVSLRVERFSPILAHSTTVRLHIAYGQTSNVHVPASRWTL